MTGNGLTAKRAPSEETASPWQRLLPALLLVAALLALPPPARAQSDVFVDAGRGLVPLHLPPAFDGVTPLPLVLNLHGYGNDGPEQQALFGLLPQSDARDFMLAIPDGEADLFGQRFWNATDACCDLFRRNPDDSAYLRGLIEAIAAAYPVDDLRVYVVGYSNGGFMSHRMACDHADRVAAIATFAGAQWEDPERCLPSEAVSVAQVHGTADQVIRYNGGCIPGSGCYPSARQTVRTWVDINGCNPQPQLRRPFLDLVQERPGRDTAVQEYRGCLGGAAELWNVLGQDHFPDFEANFAEAIVDFLLSHPKPERHGAATLP
ncbi:MAG: PHB depolymerase family esterase [Pseudomonadota bacterium]